MIVQVRSVCLLCDWFAPLKLLCHNMGDESDLQEVAEVAGEKTRDQKEAVVALLWRYVGLTVG